MIKNLVFDFGGVLLESDFDGYMQHVIGDERQREELKSLIFTPEFTARLDLGYMASDELFLELAAHYPHLAHAIDVFKTRWMEHLIGEMPGMPEILARYRQQGLHLYGLSNWSDMIYTVMEHFAVFQLLEGRVISCEEHLIKPDPAIYHCLLSRFRLVPEECVFVDDRAENVEAAQNAGMRGIVFADALQLGGQLQELLKQSQTTIKGHRTL